MISSHKNVVASVACGLALMGFGCAEPDSDVGGSSAGLRTSAGSIVEVLAADPNYSTLVAAVQFAELAAALSDPSGKLTVFAPTNAAFEEALDSLGLTAAELLSERNRELVTDILLYHVAAGQAPRSAVLALDGGSVTTLQGEDVDVNIVGRRLIQLNGEGFVVDADNFASNGVVHGVGSVLLPPSKFGSKSSLLARLERAPEFSTLVAAVKFAGLDGAISDPKAHLTLLAPDNRAFERTLSRLGLTPADLLTEKNKALLTQILLYHVISDEARSSDVRAASGSAVTTLQGEGVRVRSRLFGIIELNDKNYVTRADIDTTNGVLHVINGVLLPPSLKL